MIYLLYIGDNYYPGAGIEDLVAAAHHGSDDEATAWALERIAHPSYQDWAQLLSVDDEAVMLVHTWWRPDNPSRRIGGEKMPFELDDDDRSPHDVTRVEVAR